MVDFLKLIQERRSMRCPFDPDRPVAKEDITKILEAAKWAPTPHNMQNFEVLVVDKKDVLDRLGGIKSHVTETFLRENYAQLSFSEEELLTKKVGLLGTAFPSSWRDPQISKKLPLGPHLCRSATPSMGVRSSLS